MAKSENKLTRAKGWFLRYCETINKIARSRGEDVSPEAWEKLRECKYAKLSEKIHDAKDYKCSQEEIDMILDFYDKLANLYAKRKDTNISKENYLELYCAHRINLLIADYPAVKKVKEKVKVEPLPTLTETERKDIQAEIDAENVQLRLQAEALILDAHRHPENYRVVCDGEEVA